MERLNAELSSGNYGVDAADNIYRVKPEEHIDNRSGGTVGDRRMSAFQFDHPEVHRYYADAAGELLHELSLGEKGGQIYTVADRDGDWRPVYLRSKRTATDRIAYLLDNYHMTYADIEKALNAIVNDKGQENFAAAKRVELLLDDMLSNGYKRYDGTWAAANSEYLQAKRAIPGAAEQAEADGLPDSDGLGGADRGTLNSDFQNMQMESDAFHPVNRRAEERLRSEQGRAPSEVPEVDPNTRENISKTVSTILNAPITSGEMAPVLEQSVAEGRFDYVPVTDQAAMDRANSTIDRNGGYQKAAGIFAAKVELGQRVTKDDFALGVQCYNEAVAAGDAATALGLAGDLADAARTGAQVTQAVNLLNRLTPAGKLLTLRRYADNKPWYALSSALTSYISQGVPTVGGKVANLLDDTARKAYVPSNAGEVSGDLQYFGQSLLRKVPGGRNTLQPNVDVWGQEISNGSLAERLAESFVSPGFISVAKDDAVTEEVRRLAGKVGSGVYPAKAEKSFEVNGKREYLDGDRYTAYAKALGQGRHRMLEQAMQTGGYRTMRDADKAEMISTLYQYANAKAKKAVAPEYTMTKAMQKYADAEKAGVSPAEWYLLKAGADTDGSGGVSQKEAKAALDLSGLTEREKAAVWPLFNSGWAKNNPYT